MAKVWADFHNLVIPEVAGCALPSAEQAIREATIEFFERSGVLVHQPTDIPVVAGTSTYELTPPAGYAVMRVDELMFGEQRLFPVSNSELSQMYTSWLTIDGTPQHYLQETTTSVRLIPRPDPALTFTDALTARLVLAPSRAATGFAEDWVFEKWATDIAAGAVALLLRQGGKPWTDLQRAVGFGDAFRRGWADARSSADRGKAGAVLQVRLKRHI